MPYLICRQIKFQLALHGFDLLNFLAPEIFMNGLFHSGGLILGLCLLDQLIQNAFFNGDRSSHGTSLQKIIVHPIVTIFLILSRYYSTHILNIFLCIRIPHKFNTHGS